MLADSKPAAAIGSVDVVLPVLHGPFGEDGTVQGLLELADVPYVGAGVAASALCMDKDLFKAVLRDRGIPVARNATMRLGDEIENPFGYPVFVKPARLGSSVGISKAHDEAELETAVALARRHDEKVLVEEFVAGTEVECGVLGNLRPAPIASVVGEIVPHGEWYDYAAKYDLDGSDIIVPARIPDETAARVQELAVDSFIATECEGMARVDFFVREDGEVVVNELNTIPGLHRHERLRTALRGVRDPVRGAARPADPAGARAARAPLRPAVLAASSRPACQPRPNASKRSTAACSSPDPPGRPRARAARRAAAPNGQTRAAPPPARRPRAARARAGRRGGS